MVLCVEKRHVQQDRNLACLDADTTHSANTHACQATDKIGCIWMTLREELKNAKANARHARWVQAQAYARIVNPRSQAEARAGPRTRLASEREHTRRAVRTLHRCRFDFSVRRTRTTDNARTRGPDTEKNEKPIARSSAREGQRCITSRTGQDCHQPANHGSVTYPSRQDEAHARRPKKQRPS